MKKLKIMIKPENRGKFTKYCKRLGYSGVTNECIKRAIAKARKTHNITLLKRAIFAANARKWKK